MKRVLTLVLAIACIGTLSAQSAQSLVDQYLEKIGGAKQWENIKTMKTKATMSMQGMSFGGTIYAKYPDKQRVEVDVNGTQMIQAYDGETAWWINPFAGATTAQKMPDQMAGSMTNQKFEPSLLNYEEKGHTAELLGEKEVAGVSTHELRLGKKDGNVEVYYFNKENMLPVMMATKGTGPTGQEQTIETFFDDYKEVGTGLIMPHSITVKMGGSTLQELSFENISLNEEMGDELFAFPKE